MEVKNISEKKRFSIVARAKSFTHAGRGIYIFIKSTHNAWIHIAFLLFLTAISIFFKITSIEWIVVIFSSFLMLIMEAINTAIEIDIDLTSPNYHPYAKDTKDVAAGAVLLTAIMAITVNLIIFIPYFLRYFPIFG